jgi:6-phosphogluconolactonase
MIGQADTFVYVSMPAEKKIQVFRLDPENGKLTSVDALAVEGSPGALCVDTDKKHLFASLRTIDSLASYAIDAKTGKLKLVSTILREKGGNAAYVNYHKVKHALYSASYMAGNWGWLKINDDGAFDKQSKILMPTAKTAHAVVFSPDGQWFFVPHVEPNEIFQYRLEQNGRLTGVVAAKGGTPKAGPRHLAFHPTLPMAYSSDETGNCITAYSFDPKTGLKAVETLSTLPPDFKGMNTTAEVKVHPNGKFVWVSNRGHDSLAGFAIDATGKLKAIGQTPTEKTPRSFEITPDGRWLFGAGEGNGKLAVYRIDAESGKLDRVQTYDVGKSLTWVMAIKLAWISHQ